MIQQVSLDHTSHLDLWIIPFCNTFQKCSPSPETRLAEFSSLNAHSKAGRGVANDSIELMPWPCTLNSSLQIGNRGLTVVWRPEH
jgi:hypothetical protein